MSDLNWRPEHLKDLRDALVDLAKVRRAYDVSPGPSYDGDQITFLDQTIRLYWDNEGEEYIIEEVSA